MLEKKSLSEATSFKIYVINDRFISYTAITLTEASKLVPNIV